MEKNTELVRVFCPHCGAELESDANMLRAINISCSTSYDRPDCELYGYRFFFTGYKSAQNNCRLTGQAIAWSSPFDKASPMYYSDAGSGRASEYKRGESFDVSGIDLVSRDVHDVKMFLDAKEDSLKALKALIAERHG